jgi:hypothetical protein
VFTWPDGGMTPFRATKGTIYEGGFRVPAIIRWPGKVTPRSVENGIFSGLDWLPTLAAAAGDPGIKDKLLKGVELEGRTYKNTISTAIINWTSSWARGHPSATNSFTSAVRILAHCGQMTSNSSSSAASGLAGGEGRDGHADHHQHPSGPLRANPINP